jgi:hypothetical protein
MEERGFINPTIVVTWEPRKYQFWGCFAVLDALPKMPVRIKGAGFNPREVVEITACEKNIPVAKAKVNACGAFEVHANLPAALPIGVISIKAWVEKKLRAVWPLDIMEKLPPFPRA